MGYFGLYERRVLYQEMMMTTLILPPGNTSNEAAVNGTDLPSEKH